MKLHCQEFRCPGEQEFRKTTVCSSGTLPPDIPQIWNGRFCTLIQWLFLLLEHAFSFGLLINLLNLFEFTDSDFCLSTETEVRHTENINLYSLHQFPSGAANSFWSEHTVHLLHTCMSACKSKCSKWWEQQIHYSANGLSGSNALQGGPLISQKTRNMSRKTGWMKHAPTQDGWTISPKSALPLIMRFILSGVWWWG